MKLRSVLASITLFAASSLLPGQVSPSNFDDLVRQRRWVELRSAASQNDNAAFYRAIAAAVFNEAKAESLFKRVIRDVLLQNMPTRRTTG
jgi:hypothetical protein